MLPRKYDPQRLERKWQLFWQDEEIFRFRPDSRQEVFSIDTPPPTVSGNLHIGHVFSYTQAEMIARFQRMQGKNVFYPFGFDDNGLPTERLVEKEQGIRAKDLPRSRFNQLCLATTAKYVKEFRQLWQAMGFSVDWGLQYETISPLAQRVSQRSFIDLVNKGKAYQAETPVLWCPNCATSIAQAELEFAELESTFNWIPFRVGEEVLTIATTRPELLYGCVSLFVHPEDQRYQRFIGKEAQVPIYDYPVPIRADSRVAMDKGSGVVMCCTFGDTTDLEWFRIYQLPYRRVITPEGTIAPDVPVIGDLAVGEGRRRIIEELEAAGLLLKQERITHSVAVHERCGREVEIVPSRQWFIDLLNHKQLFLDAAEKINWYPSYMKERYRIWVENLKWDWCISRQRYFGVPFPVWYCQECGQPQLAEDDMLPVNPLETEPKQPCTCGSHRFQPETAVMDTWATSAVTPLINALWREEADRTDTLLPMSMRTQAHEIIRTWAFYTIAKHLFHTGEIPWKDVMICGFVLAKKGEKLSKSKGNAPLAPQELLAEFSADGLRYWAASSKLGTDATFSMDELKGSQRFLTKLWNAARFVLLHLEDFAPAKPVERMPIDCWIAERLDQTKAEAIRLLKDYEVGAARQEIDQFFWHDFCDNYLEIVKDRLYKPDIHGPVRRRAAQDALYECLLGILQLYAIYVPHITEEIYQTYFRQFERSISLHQTTYRPKASTDDKLLKFGQMIDQVLSTVRRHKSERNLSLKAEIPAVVIHLPAWALAWFETSVSDLRTCTGTDQIKLVPDNDFAVHVADEA